MLIRSERKISGRPRPSMPIPTHGEPRERTNVGGREGPLGPVTCESVVLHTPSSLQGDPSGWLKPPVDLIPPYFLCSRAVLSYSAGPPVAGTSQT